MDQIAKYLAPFETVNGNLLEKIIILSLRYEYSIRTNDSTALHDIDFQLRNLGIEFYRNLIDQPTNKSSLTPMKKFNRASYFISGVQGLTKIYVGHNETRYLSPTDNIMIDLFTMNPRDDYLIFGTYFDTEFEYHFSYDRLNLISKAFRNKDDVINGVEFLNFILYYVDPNLLLGNTNHIYMSGKRLTLGFLPFEGQIKYFTGEIYQDFSVLSDLFVIFSNSYLNAYHLSAGMNLGTVHNVDTIPINTVREILWSICIVSSSYNKKDLISSNQIFLNEGTYNVVYRDYSTHKLYNSFYLVQIDSQTDPRNPINFIISLGVWITNHTRRITGVIPSRSTFDPETIISLNPPIELTRDIIAQMGPLSF